MNKSIKVLVVDDSAFMRKSISLMLESDDDIEVIATARDGLEGFNLAKKLMPDVITMDIEMPQMDGLTSLQKIMKECPTNVIMLSSLTTDGAASTITALEYGAVDFIPKELSYINVNIIKIKEDLIRKVKEFSKQKALRDRLTRLQRLSGQYSVTAQKSTANYFKLPKLGYKAVALGISTGGPLSLQKVIPKLKQNINCPFFIVQHMPPKFTKSLAERLNDLSELTVKEAENNELIKNNTVYIAPGGFHMKLNQKVNKDVSISISEEPSDTLHRPSVDVMINSVVKVYGKYTLGIIMTGMGKDGLEGIKSLKSLTGYTIAQDENSCVVYGMPRAIVDAGYADVVAPLEDIPEIINRVL